MYQIYDIYTFIEKIKVKNLQEIRKEAENEIYCAESGSFGVKGAVKKRKMGSLEYANNLKDLLFFIGHGIKPSRISESVFYAFKPICRNLIKKKQFTPEIMKIFKK